MKCVSVLIAASLGTFVYVAVSLTGGHDGFWAAKQLSEQRRTISVRTAEIQNINTNLTLEYTALQKDPDVIAAYARKLGYVSEHEKLIKINGLKPAPSMVYTTGIVLKRQEIFSLPEWLCKALGLSVFFLSLLLLFLADYRTGGRKQPKIQVIKGIPVYDVPQI